MANTVSENPNSGIDIWLTKVSENSNFTDPEVIYDPEITKPIAAKEYQTLGSNQFSRVASNHYYGTRIPIININNKSIGINMLDKVVLTFNDFFPTLELTINDPKKDFQFTGGLGLNNRVSIILTPTTNGIYHKMSIPFYIKDQINYTNGKIKFICDYYHNGLWKNACEQIGDKALTTYEFFETISKQLQLGFAATKKCKDISDPRWRQIYSQRISDFIISQLKLGGLDEDSIFDAWIDPYGYIILSNLSYIFKEDVKPEDLSMKIDVVDKNIPIEDDEYYEKEPQIFKRYITNISDIPLRQNRIKEQYNNLNTTDTSSYGTLRNCWIMKDAGNSNVLEMQNIQIIEDSVDGYEASSFYESTVSEFLGMEMSEDTPYLMQQEIRKSFLAKKRSRRITVILEDVNFAFQRGLLVNGLFVETDKMKIIKINGYQSSMLNTENEKESSTSDHKENFEMNKENLSSDSQKDIVRDFSDGAMALNPALSGIYYIDGVKYIYDSEEQRIYQYLYLIKKDLQTTLNNIFNAPKIN